MRCTWPVDKFKQVQEAYEYLTHPDREFDPPDEEITEYKAKNGISIHEGFYWLKFTGGIISVAYVDWARDLVNFTGYSKTVSIDEFLYLEENNNYEICKFFAIPARLDDDNVVEKIKREQRIYDAAAHHRQVAEDFEEEPEYIYEAKNGILIHEGFFWLKFPNKTISVAYVDFNNKKVNYTGTHRTLSLEEFLYLEHEGNYKICRFLPTPAGL